VLLHTGAVSAVIPRMRRAWPPQSGARPHTVRPGIVVLRSLLSRPALAEREADQDVRVDAARRTERQCRPGSSVARV